jgi:hypothetical protein
MAQLNILLGRISELGRGVTVIANGATDSHSTLHAIHADHLGTPRVIIDSEGKPLGPGHSTTTRSARTLLSAPAIPSTCVSRASTTQRQKERAKSVRGLLKVIKRGGPMSEGFLPVWLAENLFREQCANGDQGACVVYCKFNSEECEEAARKECPDA